MTELATRLRKMMPQSVCADDLDEWASHIEMLESDPSSHFCHRFAILLECMVITNAVTLDSYWQEVHVLLNEYHEARDKWMEAQGQPYVSGFGRD